MQPLSQGTPSATSLYITQMPKLNQPISNIWSIELSIYWIVAGYTFSRGAWGSAFPL